MRLSAAASNTLNGPKIEGKFHGGVQAEQKAAAANPSQFAPYPDGHQAPEKTVAAKVIEAEAVTTCSNGLLI